MEKEDRIEETDGGLSINNWSDIATAIGVYSGTPSEGFGQVDHFIDRMTKEYLWHNREDVYHTAIFGSVPYRFRHRSVEAITRTAAAEYHRELAEIYLSPTPCNFHVAYLFLILFFVAGVVYLSLF